MTDTRVLRNDGLLLTSAAIWGFAFVAQRVGMQYLGPFAFNGVRFALGSIVILPVWAVFSRINAGRQPVRPIRPQGLFRAGLLSGTVLFVGATLQQIGIVDTTAGKAGFITGLYVVIVPLLGLALRQKSGTGRWIGAALAAAGLYLLSVTGSFTMERGDFLVFLSALFWAVHVHVLAAVSPRFNSLALAAIQYAVCSGLSLGVASLREGIDTGAILSAAMPIIYGGVFSVGVAYTLQVVAQKEAHPAHAAIVLCLEGPFAVLGGRLILQETLSIRAVLGCCLMFAGMLSAQGTVFVQAFRRRRRP